MRIVVDENWIVIIVPMSIVDDRASLILNERNGVPERVTNSQDDVDVICKPSIEPVHEPAAIPKSVLNPINIFPFLDIAR